MTARLFDWRDLDDVCELLEFFESFPEGDPRVEEMLGSLYELDDLVDQLRLRSLDESVTATRGHLTRLGAFFATHRMRLVRLVEALLRELDELDELSGGQVVLTLRG